MSKIFKNSKIFLVKQLNSVLHWIRQKSPVERKSPNQEIPTILRLYWNWVLFWSKHHSFTFYYFSPIYSRLSLALMEDSGWYIPDYSLGRIFWDVYRDLSRGGINLYDIPLVWGGDRVPSFRYTPSENVTLRT